MLRVLYVVGEGRSGSTILDVLLGNHPEIFGAGELWSFWSGDPARTGPCSCGRPFDECPFWAGVMERYVAQLDDGDVARSGRLRERMDQARRIARRKIRRDDPGERSRYEREAAALYRTIAEASGKNVLVDSTKQVGRAFNLARIESLDVRIIHLSRDGRGVVWSRMRDVRKDPTLKRHAPSQSIVNWTVKNNLASRLAEQAGDRYVHVRYEDLIRFPERELRRIGEACGLDFGAVVERLNTSGEFEVGHQIGGNEAARLGGGKKSLRLDEEWRSALPRKYDMLFKLVAGRTAKRLGHPL